MKALNDDLQMRSDWTLPICSGQERLKDASGRKAHPTQKPEALLHRVILASTQPNELVVDPFIGSGTTGAVAKRLRRRWLGFELDADYAAVARQRIDAVVPVDDPTLVAIESRREAPRVPFGWLVERGLVQVGDLLVGGSGNRYTAKVRADGTIVSADHKGSIHQVGAAVQGAPSCNGWTFWHVAQADGSLVALDVLRQKLRAELS
jgi:modification methylase